MVPARTVCPISLFACLQRSLAQLALAIRCGVWASGLWLWMWSRAASRSEKISTRCVMVGHTSTYRSAVDEVLAAWQYCSTKSYRIGSNLSVTNPSEMTAWNIVIFNAGLNSCCINLNVTLKMQNFGQYSTDFQNFKNFLHYRVSAIEQFLLLTPKAATVGWVN